MNRSSPRGRRSLRILVIGGTGFIGRHLVRTAVDRGHTVSVFSRGKGPVTLPNNVEHLAGDRNEDQAAITGRDWDEVFDLVAYYPSQVAALGRAIGNRVKHYSLISTVSAYDARAARGKIAENGKLLDFSDGISALEVYGAFKVLCEREAELQFPGRTLLLRPCVIVGPGGEHGMLGLTYWFTRLREGGETLIPGDRDKLIQFIDVRDLVDFALLSVERADTGAVNIVGPAMDIGWGELVDAILDSLSASAQLTWVPVPWLIEHDLETEDITLFWPMEEFKPGLMNMGNEKARRSGLTFRSLQDTVRDTLAWYDAQPLTTRDASIFGNNRALRTMKDAVTRDRNLLALWKADSIRRPC